MKLFSKIIFTLAIAFLCTACNAKKAEIEKVAAGNITIEDAWARPANKGANSAVYLTIVNNTDSADTLIAVKTGIATMAGVHKTYRSGGMTGMREAGATEIELHSKFILEPGGYHIMLMNLNSSLTKGDSVKITLSFTGAGDKTVKVPVKPITNNY